MEVRPNALDEKTTVTILVTGANSGLGFSICCRLIDEFLVTRPQSQSLHLLYSTRDTKKSDDTLKRLNAHLQNTLKDANRKTPGISLLLEGRIKLEGVLVDLSKLLAVKALAKQLLIRRQPLDAVIWNAGIAGWTGVNYAKATWAMCTKFVEALTYPTFMDSDVGLLTGRQLGGYGQVHTFSEPKLGQVFTSNVFGHYMLTHWLAPLMNSNTRIIWISSVKTTPDMFTPDDLQGVQTKEAYESSKRLTDLLVLNSERPATGSQVDTFFSGVSQSAHGDEQQERHPQMYVTHPGVVATNISETNIFIYWSMIALCHIARWLGSPWHPIWPYKGAVSAVFAALAPSSQLSDLETRDGKGKWGSATDTFGNERVVRTEIEGWGYGRDLGSMPSGSVQTKRRDYKQTTKEMREDFEDEGRKVWRDMEELRVDWEQRLGRIEVESASSVDV